MIRTYKFLAAALWMLSTSLLAQPKEIPLRISGLAADFQRSTALRDGAYYVVLIDAPATPTRGQPHVVSHQRTGQRTALTLDISALPITLEASVKQDTYSKLIGDLTIPISLTKQAGDRETRSSQLALALDARALLDHQTSSAVQLCSREAAALGNR